MNLNHFIIRFICSKIGLDPTRCTVNISFKYDMSGKLLAFPVEDWTQFVSLHLHLNDSVADYII